MIFQNELIKWYQIYKRDLPWRHTNDAYIIWLSEIILQQTRVEQGMPYFIKFLSEFPTIAHFANADESKVLKLWQGLGYYSRGRNMHTTARYVMENYGGKFPTSYNELIKLKGIGEYTAAAISSFSNNEAKAVVDGNVFRVLARYFGIHTPINTSEGKKEFFKLANELLFTDNPALYNQAIMEFGALQCKPKSPNCAICPLIYSCYAYKTNNVFTLPVKVGKMVKKNRYINYLILRDDDKILVRKRKAGDIWQHLYDFPSIELDSLTDLDYSELLKKVKEVYGIQCVISFISSRKHILTHQIIHLQFFELNNYIVNFSNNDNFYWVTLDEFNELPQSKVIQDFISAYILR
jgi:A/G-specific adenine glycosylase